jgi:hypothetical protein
MVDFMAADTMEDMLVAFERTRTLAQVSRTGGPGFFEELKGKITPKLDYKRGHLLRIINKKVSALMGSEEDVIVWVWVSVSGLCCGWAGCVWAPTPRL